MTSTTPVVTLSAPDYDLGHVARRSARFLLGEIVGEFLNLGEFSGNSKSMRTLLMDQVFGDH